MQVEIRSLVSKSFFFFLHYGSKALLRQEGDLRKTTSECPAEAELKLKSACVIRGDLSCKQGSRKFLRPEALGAHSVATWRVGTRR